VKKLERIKVRKDYLAIAATGRRWVTPAFVLQTKDSDDKEREAHVGFTAVVRNRVRRRLKEAARAVFSVRTSLGREYVLIGRHACLDMAYERIKSDMTWALKKLDAGADLNAASINRNG
jgi:ribonuclease P protein component